MECPSCNGTGCEACGDRGDVHLTECPLVAVPGDAWQVIEMADLLKHGLPPLAGGMLDQVQVFVDAARFVWGEQTHWRATLGILTDG